MNSIACGRWKKKGPVRKASRPRRGVACAPRARNTAKATAPTASPTTCSISSRMTWKTRQRERIADMTEVYIDSLTLENFGPFYGEHTLNFGSLDGRCGILVGGKNGAGKTHLLRALYLAVVGESGVGDLRRVSALAVVA